ncbi:larval/pupal rigid cuticle protein 66-like [Daktulosphaira vitifoliae]|uniref:larval/pupal rigid cuticle protein 66-like n=1 Tax=Daktulosphaira vitifoliae TaxID=58002 RepID=UPI0021A9943E|nr:larval/pupal rigid cuticle protein 66-like [Daktulosphaira vitifoliae]
MKSVQVFLFVSAFVCAVFGQEIPTSSFAYGVNDPMTGDHKEHHEVKVGDAVSGFYRTLDADGLMRTVDYKADAFNGFTADVKREPASVAAPVAPVEPVVYKTELPSFHSYEIPAIYKAAPFSSYYSSSSSMIGTPYYPYAKTAITEYPSILPSPYYPLAKTVSHAYPYVESSILPSYYPWAKSAIPALPYHGSYLPSLKTGLIAPLKTFGSYVEPVDLLKK